MFFQMVFFILCNLTFAPGGERKARSNLTFTSGDVCEAGMCVYCTNVIKLIFNVIEMDSFYLYYYLRISLFVILSPVFRRNSIMLFKCSGKMQLVFISDCFSNISNGEIRQLQQFGCFDHAVTDQKFLR